MTEAAQEAVAMLQDLPFLVPVRARPVQCPDLHLMPWYNDLFRFFLAVNQLPIASC